MIACACPSRRILCALLLGAASLLPSASSFHSPATLTFHKHTQVSSSWGQNSLVPASGSVGSASRVPSFGRRQDSNSGSSTRLQFMGSDGGILGIGGPELVSMESMSMSIQSSAETARAWWLPLSAVCLLAAIIHLTLVLTLCVLPSSYYRYASSPCTPSLTRFDSIRYS